jgi:hypothetical protein
MIGKTLGHYRIVEKLGQVEWARCARSESQQQNLAGGPDNEKGTVYPD